jgi:uncharacterized protein YndB with AHSA1/START domain
VKTIEAVTNTSAAPEAVWSLLADAEAWPRWGSWSETAVEGGGQLGPGAVRMLTARGFRVRERITVWEPGERLGYELVDGMKVEGYRSTVTLERADGGGTTIRWRSTYERAGWFMSILLTLAVRDAAKRLASAATASA